ncbi:MAG: AAA family ATPase [Bacteroidia bacterium]
MLAWKQKQQRKPLIIRGARQVGKSTLIQEFGKGYRHFVSLNLERPRDRRFFDREREVRKAWQQILFEHNLPDEPEDTLLFLDEIQELPHVIRQLRYFYEDLPRLHVIAAGSLLEFSLGDVRSFPVGRVEEMALHPLDFEEFLMAADEQAALEQLRQIPLQSFAYDKLFRLYRQYLIIGGMPEVIKTFLHHPMELSRLREVYASIWDAYKSDIVKYARNHTETQVLRHLMSAAPYARDRIVFAGFGASNYRSREVGKAFRALNQARIMYLLYPTTQTVPPLLPDLTRRPRLQFLDTGLMNYASHIQAELLGLEDLNDYHRGFVVQHGAVQELIANPVQSGMRPLFWVRENANTNAEVDILCHWKTWLVPVEVKAGPQGRLRSLQEYMDLTPHNLAIRLLSNMHSVETVHTRRGKDFRLLNLPYFMASQLDRWIEWAAEIEPLS